MVNLIYFSYKVWYLDQGIFVSGFCFCLFMFNWSSTISFLLYLIAFTLFVKNQLGRASLVAQWYRICLPMQETKVQSLIWGDPTCHRATKSMHLNYWACALEPTEPQLLSPCAAILKPQGLQHLLHNKGSHSNEKPTHHN